MMMMKSFEAVLVVVDVLGRLTVLELN